MSVFTLGPSDRSSARIDRSPHERIHSAGCAAMAYWFYYWDWGESIAFDALDFAARQAEIPMFREFVDSRMDDWVSLPYDGSPSRFGPGRLLIERFRRTGDGKYLKFADALGRHLLGLPRHPSGAIPLDAGTDMVFTDSNYGEPAFLLELGRITGNAAYSERGVGIALGLARVLQCERTGLYRHFCKLGAPDRSAVKWGRGNGWAVLGIADTLSLVEPGIPGAEELHRRFADLCEGLATHEVPGGGWRNIIDEPSSYPEFSTTAMVSAGLSRALSAGLIRAEHSAVAQRAWSVVEHRLDSSGHLTNVSYRPGVNTDPSRYEHTATPSGAYPWSQGAYLLCSCHQLIGSRRSGEKLPRDEEADGTARDGQPRVSDSPTAGS